MEEIIEENLELLFGIWNRKFDLKDDIIKYYSYEKVRRCEFHIEDQDKLCNKKIKNKKFKNYCEIHFKLKKMLDNMESKNDNVNNFTLKEYQEDLFVDVFDNVFKIDENKLLFYGVIKEGELVVNK